MTQEDLEKVICIIINNTPGDDMKEAVRLIIELVKAVYKPAEVQVVHDGISKNTHWEQPCSTATDVVGSMLSDSMTSSSSSKDFEGKLETITAKNNSLSDIFAAMDKAAPAAINKRGFAK